MRIDNMQREMKLSSCQLLPKRVLVVLRRSVKADSHIAWRAHAVPLPCRAVPCR